MFRQTEEAKPIKIPVVTLGGSSSSGSGSGGGSSSGGAEVNGNYTGRALANGTLMGAGANGPEMVDLPDDAIVFNAD